MQKPLILLKAKEGLYFQLYFDRMFLASCFVSNILSSNAMQVWFTFRRPDIDTRKLIIWFLLANDITSFLHFVTK